MSGQIASPEDTIKISKSQAIAIFLFKNDYERNLEKMKEMQIVIDSCIKAIPELKKERDNLERISLLKDLQIKSRDEVQLTSEKIIKHRERQIIWLKVKIGAVAVGVNLAWILALYLRNN